MGYVIVRDDQNPEHSRHYPRVGSYTRFLQHARVFPTREAAEHDRCPENERVVTVDAVLSPRGRF